MKPLLKLGVLVAMLGNCQLSKAASAEWAITVDDAGKVSSSCATLVPTLSCFVPGSANKANMIEDSAVLVVNCADKPKCDSVVVAKEEGGTIITKIETSSVEGDGKTRRYAIEKSLFEKQGTLGIFIANEMKNSFIVAASLGVPPSGDRPPSCTFEVSVSPYPSGNDGRAKKNVKTTVVVDALGNVLAKPADFMFDENDTLEVQVVGLKSVVDKLQVKRTSGFRDITVVRVLGEGATVSSLASEKLRQSSLADLCITRSYSLSDFAPGRGIVELSSNDGGKSTKISEFDFQVHPLYVGMFTVGWISTRAIDPGFKLVNSGTQNVIAHSDVSTRDNLYSLLVTPYVWGKRDPEKPFSLDASLLDRINPSIGLVVDNIKDNVLLGVSIDLPAGVLFTFGKHYRHSTVLSPQSGLQIGSAFSGAVTDIPTARSWVSENFYGVSIDLRIMAKFFAALGNSGK